MKRLMICALALTLMSGQASAEKSPKTAFLLSLLMPGLGEFYAGAKMRAAGFVGAEALTWIAYTSWRSKGNDIKAEFRAFADQNWNESRYRAWQAYNASQPESQQYFETETLPSKSEDIQQYYELVGKYAQFVYGWSDVTSTFTTDNMAVQSSLRQQYETRRNDSNKYLKRASVITGLAVLNRIASAIHASAYTRSLQKQEEPSIWLDITPTDMNGRSSVELKARF